MTFVATAAAERALETIALRNELARTGCARWGSLGFVVATTRSGGGFA